MKPLLHIFTFILLALSFEAHAAKIGLKHNSDDTVIGKKESGNFADAYTFSVPVSVDNLRQTQTFLISIGQVRNFAALLDNMDLQSIRKSWDKGSDKRVEIIVSNFSALATPSIISGGEVSGPVGNVSTTNDIPGNTNPGSQAAVAPSLPTPIQAAPITVISTPIPAAIWLFGSVILGLFGAKRRFRVY